MMESPFFRRDWFSPTVRDVRGIPVKHDKAWSPTPKVISIPVQFVGSERSRSDSALTIQKVFRGFLVRKSVKKIAAIKREVDAIAKRISTEETVELMRRDSKERLKVNETLMSLLFRLDSIRAVNSGVRDCRKSVIKKAIALQEMVDSIAVAGSQFEARADAAVDSDDVKIAGQDSSQECEADAIQPVEEQGEVPNLEHSSSRSADQLADQVAEEQNVTDPTHDSGGPEQTNSPSVNECGEESAGTSQTESQSDSSALPQSLIEGGEEENINTTSVKQEDQEEVKFSGNVDRAREENKRSQELLERMVEDNEKMMGLMGELFERNEMQRRLLCSLSRRVEQLEKAFTSAQKRRKKRNATGGLGSSHDTRKCGKRE